MREEGKSFLLQGSFSFFYRQTPDSLTNGFLSVELNPPLKRRDVKTTKNSA
jgi:hypothetical protein